MLPPSSGFKWLASTYNIASCNKSEGHNFDAVLCENLYIDLIVLEDWAVINFLWTLLNRVQIQYKNCAMEQIYLHIRHSE
jgi:hypothetical protein